MNQPESWARRATGLLPAIPAQEALKHLSLNDTLKAGLAAASYRLKNGESVWLSLPIHARDALRSIVRYAHEIRLEAISGQQRAAWVNRPNLLPRGDLLVWTRSQGHIAGLQAEPELGAQWVRAQSRRQVVVPVNHDRILRTLLCQATGSLTALCDMLSIKSHAFLQLVDLTPFGVREGVDELLDHLENYFPRVPRLILTTSGDRDMENQLSQRPTPCLHWAQPPAEPTEWFSGSPMGTQLRLIECPDHRLEEPLVALCSDIQTLRESLHQQPQLRSTVNGPLSKVVRELQGLVVPMSFHNQFMLHKRRGGPFAIMPLRDRLSQVARVDMPTGESTQLRDQIVKQLLWLIGQTESGITGKQQALSRWLQQKPLEGKPRLIVVNTELDATLLRGWLVREREDELANGALSVVGVSSVRECLRGLGQRRIGQALIIGHLWDEAQWSLGIAEHVDWLTYPREFHAKQRVAKRWLAGTTIRPEDKAPWWELAPVVMLRPGGDPVTIIVPADLWGMCSGEYPGQNSIKVNVSNEPDFLAELLVPIPESQDFQNTPPGEGEVTITTVGGERYRYFETQRVYTIKSEANTDTLVTKSAKELSSGDVLVELTSDAGACYDLFETLLEIATESSESQKLLTLIAQRWAQYVDHALHACGDVAMLHRKLSDGGVRVSLATVRNWVNHSVIGPNNARNVVPLMARLSQLKHSPEDIRSLINAQRKVKGFHNQIGKLLKQMVLPTQARNTNVEGSLAGTIDEELLADLVSVDTVSRVHHHPVVRQVVARESVEDLLRSLLDRYPDRVTATNRAFQSAKDCPYRDLDGVNTCMESLVTDYFSVYREKRISIQEAIRKSQRHNIEFAGGVSVVTRGQYPGYRRQYRNKTVEIERHLKLGNSRDPSRCFRLYFHWDEDDRKIVIHHAGRHLEDSKS